VRKAIGDTGKQQRLNPDRCAEKDFALVGPVREELPNRAKRRFADIVAEKILAVCWHFRILLPSRCCRFEILAATPSRIILPTASWKISSTGLVAHPLAVRDRFATRVLLTKARRWTKSRSAASLVCGTSSKVACASHKAGCASRDSSWMLQQAPIFGRSDLKGRLDDIFELQDQIATSIVGAIASQLERAEIERARGGSRPVISVPTIHYLAGHAVSASWNARGD